MWVVVVVAVECGYILFPGGGVWVVVVCGRWWSWRWYWFWYWHWSWYWYWHYYYYYYYYCSISWQIISDRWPLPYL